MIEMRLDINITGLEGLAASIQALANSLSGNIITEKPQSSADLKQAAATQPVIPPTDTALPAQTPATPVPTTVALTQQPSAQQPVATSALSYTLDDLARAAAPLMDSGVGQIALQQLLASFGVVALPELPQERYAEFAAALREMGAQI